MKRQSCNQSDVGKEGKREKMRAIWGFSDDDDDDNSAQLDGCGYMEPRIGFRPMTYRIGQPPGIVYTSIRHSAEDRENRNNLPSHGPEDSPAREHYHRHSSTPEEQDLDDVCDNKVSRTIPLSQKYSRLFCIITLV